MIHWGRWPLSLLLIHQPWGWDVRSRSCPSAPILLQLGQRNAGLGQRAIVQHEHVEHIIASGGFLEINFAVCKISFPHQQQRCVELLPKLPILLLLRCFAVAIDVCCEGVFIEGLLGLVALA